MLLTILFGYIPIIFGLVGGSIYMIDTIKQICIIRKFKKQKKDFLTDLVGLCKEVNNKNTD